MLSAGPGEILLPPLPIFSHSLSRDGGDLVTHVEGARIEATVVAAHEGYELQGGRLCGYVTQAQILAEMNSFVESNCDCLNLSGPLVLDHDTESPSCAPVDFSECGPDDPIEDDCSSYAQNCSLMLTMLPNYMDVDLDGDPSKKEAMSLGVRFLAAPVGILTEVPSILSCVALLDCYNSCPEEQACLDACYSAASRRARTQLDLLHQCLNEHCPGGEIECMNAAVVDPERCQAEAQDCFG